MNSAGGYGDIDKQPLWTDEQSLLLYLYRAGTPENEIFQQLLAL